MFSGGDGRREVFVGVVALRVVVGAWDAGLAGMFENAEIEGLFVWLDAP